MDLTRVNYQKKRPSVEITAKSKAAIAELNTALEKELKEKIEIPSFLEQTFISDNLTACFFKDSVSKEGTYFYDSGMLMLPASFKYVDYSLKKNGSGYKIVDLDKIIEYKYNFFSPIVLNLNDKADSDRSFHHCDDYPKPQDGTFFQGKGAEGCPQLFNFDPSANPIGSGLKPIYIFYYDAAENNGDKNLRTSLTTENGTDVLKEEVIYYLILLLMPEKQFVYYAIRQDEAEGENGVLQIWINELTRKDRVIAGIAVHDRLCYNDELGVFITSDAQLVSKKQ
jgi:hypothetical protein